MDKTIWWCRPRVTYIKPETLGFLVRVNVWRRLGWKWWQVSWYIAVFGVVARGGWYDGR